MVESLSSDGLSLDRSSTDVVTVEVGQNIVLTGSNMEVVNPRNSSSSPEIVLWTTSSGEQSGTYQTSASWANSNGSTTSGPTTPSTPLNTPLSVAGVTLQSPAQGNSRGAQAKVPAFNTPPTRGSSAQKGSSGQPWSPSWRTDSKFSGSKMRVNQASVY